MRVLSSIIAVIAGSVLILALLILLLWIEPCNSNSFFWVPARVVQEKVMSQMRHQWKWSQTSTTQGTIRRVQTGQQQVKGDDRKERILLKLNYYSNRLSYWCSTTTVTTTTTSTVSTNTFCASFFNVRGACRKKRIDDDDDDDDDDLLAENEPLQPTERLTIEVTSVPSLLSDDNKQVPPDDGHYNVQSSMLIKEPRYVKKVNTSTKLRFFPLLSCFLSHPFYTTVTSTSTSTSYTSTVTFTITNCIPQPFSYVICSTVGKR